MQRYLDTEGCLMAFLATALDDPSSQACGQCAGCLDRPVVEPSFDRPQIIAATRFLRQSEMPLVCPVRVPGNAFPTYGFSGNLPQELRAETGRILSAGVMRLGTNRGGRQTPRALYGRVGPRGRRDGGGALAAGSMARVGDLRAVTRPPGTGARFCPQARCGVAGTLPSHC